MYTYHTCTKRYRACGRSPHVTIHLHTNMYRVPRVSPRVTAPILRSESPPVARRACTRVTCHGKPTAPSLSPCRAAACRAVKQSNTPRLQSHNGGPGGGAHMHEFLRLLFCRPTARPRRALRLLVCGGQAHQHRPLLIVSSRHTAFL